MAMQKERQQTELWRVPEPCGQGTGNGAEPQVRSGAELPPEALAAQGNRHRGSGTPRRV